MKTNPPPTKPLGIKAYGHIPHLPDSRLGPGDHKVHEGQARICTAKARDRHDRIIVTEKVDGSNVAIAKIEGCIVPLGRAGYRAETSPYPQHRMFADWVMRQQDRFNWLCEGERLCGEWLAQAHGTKYELPHEPFVAFDLMYGKARAPFDEFNQRVALGGMITPRILFVGGPVSVAAVSRQIETSGHGAIDPVEGAVWRVERRGEVDFLAKWVRPDKVDGSYLPEVSGEPAVWNWQPDWEQRHEVHAKRLRV